MISILGVLICQTNHLEIQQSFTKNKKPSNRNYSNSNKHSTINPLLQYQIHVKSNNLNPVKSQNVSHNLWWTKTRPKNPNSPLTTKMIDLWTTRTATSRPWTTTIVLLISKAETREWLSMPKKIKMGKEKEVNSNPWTRKLWLNVNSISASSMRNYGGICTQRTIKTVKREPKCSRICSKRRSSTANLSLRHS